MGFKTYSILISLLATVLIFQNCGPAFDKLTPASETVELQSFDNLNEKVIATHCLSCHNSSLASGGVDLSSYESIMNSGTVVPGDSQSSSLFLEVYNGSMPPSGLLPSESIDVIAEWIDEGARDSSGIAANEVPVVNAGSDINLVLPQGSVFISGDASDSDGRVVDFQWTQLSGPNQATLSGANSSDLVVSNVAEGTYTFQLEVTDDFGAKASDSVSLILSLPVNSPPTVNAGADKSLTSPASSSTLSGSATDMDGTISSTLWTQLSGPVTANIESPANLNTNITGLSQTGTYEFQLAATDNSGDSSTDSVKVTVNPAGNVLPIANAGADKSITLPTSSITLTGSGSDSDGTIASYMWSQVSGPNTATLSGANSTTLTASNLIEGQYRFQLMVTDNSGGQGTDQVMVVVNAAPAAPTFTELNQTIFGPKCLSCHSGANPKGNYGMDNYNLVMSQVTAGNANASELFLRVQDNTMPKGGPGPLSSTEKSAIQDWINAGASNT